MTTKVTKTPDPAACPFFTSHAHVLLCLAREPGVRMLDIALRLGLTERWVQQIVKELAASGHITRRRVGRNNHYVVNPDAPLQHHAESEWRVEDLLKLATRRDRGALDGGASTTE